MSVQRTIAQQLIRKLMATSQENPYVVERGDRLSLHFNQVSVQSEMNVTRPDELAFDYTRVMMGFLLFNDTPQHIEMIGLGGGSLAKYCYRKLPSARISVAEINPDVIALRERFLVPADDERFEVLCIDGADFVRDPSRRPDVILVDGFDHKGQPRQLCSSGFYDHCFDRLADGGIMVVNLWDGDGRYGTYSGRIRESFHERVVVIPADDGTNQIVLAFKGGSFPPVRQDFLETAMNLEADHTFSVVSLAQRILHRIERRRAHREDPWSDARNSYFT
jgi:spermidine synthase